MTASSTGGGDGLARCTASELVELREFQAAMGLGHTRVVDPARSKWLFEQHPWRLDDGLTLWIYRRDGRIVGTEGGIPFKLKVGEEECRGSWVIDLMVDPKWRGQGIAAALTEAHRGSCRVSCALGFTSAGHRHAERMGSGHVATIPVFLFPVDPGRFLRGYVASNPARDRIRLLRATGPLIVAAGRVASLYCQTQSKGFRLVPIDAFDERVDEIWHDVSSAYLVMARRDAAWLRWRFDLCPDQREYRRFYLLDRKRVVGYLVLRAMMRYGESGLAVIDYLTAPNTLSGLFGCAVGAAREYGATTLLCRTLNSRARRKLRSLGFVRLKHESRSIGFTLSTPQQDPIARIVRDPDNWFLTAADCDLD